MGEDRGHKTHPRGRGLSRAAVSQRSPGPDLSAITPVVCQGRLAELQADTRASRALFTNDTDYTNYAKL